MNITRQARFTVVIDIGSTVGPYTFFVVAESEHAARELLAADMLKLHMELVSPSV